MATDFQAWQEERRSYVTSPTGNLACVNYHPVEDELITLEEIPATARLDRARDGVVITAKAEDNVTVDGALVDGEVLVGRLRPDGTPIIRHGHHSLDVFSLDGSDYELRVYSTESDNVKRFEGIDYYPEDPALVIDGVFTEHDHSHDVPWDFTRSSDSGHTKKVPGVISLTIGGSQYDLAAFADGPLLVLVFADGTTGKESYAPGRFLKMPMPDHSGTVTVDFNRTFIPPCGFSDFYSCPVPPAQNRIAEPIRGGERTVLWKDS